jgi:hypothetical protein
VGIPPKGLALVFKGEVELVELAVSPDLAVQPVLGEHLGGRVAFFALPARPLVVF